MLIYFLSALGFATSMASPASKSVTLKEHLQEQQEPFTLNIYLSERGYLVKCLSSNGRNGCCQINLFKNLRIRPSNYNLNKKMALLSAKVVKSILYKLVSTNDSQGLSCCSSHAHQDEFQTAESKGFAEVKGLGTTIGASPSRNVEEESLPSKYQPGSSSGTSQTSNLGNVEPRKSLTDKTYQGKRDQDKHLNLMSTLNKLSSDKVHHIITRQESPSSSNSTMTENAKENFSFTTFSWKLLGKSRLERYTLLGFKEGKGIIGPCCPHQCHRNQELVNQRKPLVNLPEKSVEKEDRKTIRNKCNYIHWFMGGEKLGNLVRAKQIYSCRKNSIDSSMDFSDTLGEWNYSRELQGKIGFQLGETIMDEIVEEIIDLLRQ